MDTARTSESSSVNLATRYVKGRYSPSERSLHRPDVRFSPSRLQLVHQLRRNRVDDCYTSAVSCMRRSTFTVGLLQSPGCMGENTPVEDGSLKDDCGHIGYSAEGRQDGPHEQHLAHVEDVAGVLLCARAPVQPASPVHENSIICRSCQVNAHCFTEDVHEQKAALSKPSACIAGASAQAWLGSMQLTACHWPGVPSGLLTT